MTAERIINKIETEYELFFMDMVKTSRENIFAKSGEIEKKKNLVVLMKDIIKKDNEIHYERMLTANNLIDEFYRYFIDHPDLNMNESVVEYLKNYK